MRIVVEPEVFPLARAFTISRGSRTEARVLTVTVEAEGARGRGECVPSARYGETPESVAEQIRSLPPDVTRESLKSLLPPGAARNAVDCALWDWEAKRAGRRVWALAGLPEPGPQITAFTLSLEAPDAMREQASLHAHRPLLKIKLGGEGDLSRLEAVRAGAPAARIVVDANEGWTAEGFAAVAPELVRLGVAMVEQPLPAGADEALAEMERLVPVCADESCHDRASLAGLRGKYDMVNIKLDKTGGLTEALALRDAARVEGFGVMVGCMVGSSLAMAPAVLVAQGAEVTDLDGPLLLAADRTPALRYDEKGVHPARPNFGGEHEPDRLRQRRLRAGGGGQDQRLRPRLPVRGRGLRGDQRAGRQADRLPGHLAGCAARSGSWRCPRRRRTRSWRRSTASCSRATADRGDDLSPGDARRGGPGLRLSGRAEPSLVMFTQARPLEETAAARDGMRVITVPDIRWGRRDIKTVQLLAPSMCKMMAKKAGATTPGWSRTAS
jgi:L-alanine-DL-glutamate epimerase-like enolase superfamily enzyme